MLNVICDTREQKAFTFEKYLDVVVHRAALSEGDYSLAGCEHSIALERKELGDLVNCLSHDRARFERELIRLRPYPVKAVMVEASMLDVSRHRYQSKMLPEAVLQSVFTFTVRYGIPFLFCCTRAGAEYACHSILAKYAREVRKQADAVGGLVAPPRASMISRNRQTGTACPTRFRVILNH